MNKRKMKMNKILLILAVFSFGYMFNDIVEEMDVNLIPQANAKVAGMDYYRLEQDHDFQKAVENVVDGNCRVKAGGGLVRC